jgi:hypothetical protein
VAVFSGIIRLKDDKITIIQGDKTFEFNRKKVVSLAPSGNKEFSYWSGKISLGIDIREGNKEQYDYSAKAKLKRRTSDSNLYLDYLGRTDFIPVSPFKFWLVVVVVSAISYLSYLLKKFIFPNNGMLITGFLGGLYSSTATTVVLARKSKQPETAINQASSSIVLATAMMFIRIYILILIFNQALSRLLTLPFVILTTLTFIISWLILKFEKKGKNAQVTISKIKNPLEFKTALIFAFLFVLFSFITKHVLHSFGVEGLNMIT